MTRRQYINLLLLVLIYPLNELHTEFKGTGVQFNSWLNGLNYPLDMQWFVKFFCLDLSSVLKALLIYRLSRMNQVFRIAAGVYLALCIMDLVFFFVDCNTGNYLLLYSFIGVFVIVIAYPKRMHYKKTYTPEKHLNV